MASRDCRNCPGLSQKCVHGRQHRKRKDQEQQCRLIRGGVLKALNLIVDGDRNGARHPGRLPPTIRTTPNSPSVCAKLRTTPVTTPSSESGSSTRKNVRQRDAPNVADASSRLTSTCENADAIG